MNTLTVPLSEEHFETLRKLAEKQKMTPEELAGACLAGWLARQGDDFVRAANYVLQRNADLYRRLA